MILVVLKLAANPNQFMAYTPSSRVWCKILVCNHPILATWWLDASRSIRTLNRLAFTSWIKKSQKESCPPSGQEQARREARNYERETKLACHNKMSALLEPNLSLVTAPIFQIYQSTKEGMCLLKTSAPLKTFSKKCNDNKYCDCHRDHGHNTKDYQALKSFILKLIDGGYCNTPYLS